MWDSIFWFTLIKSICCRSTGFSQQFSYLTKLLYGTLVWGGPHPIPCICHLLSATKFWGLQKLNKNVRKFAKQNPCNKTAQFNVCIFDCIFCILGWHTWYFREYSWYYQCRNFMLLLRMIWAIFCGMISMGK